MTTLSGCNVSCTAVPSFRNSGTDAVAKSTLATAAIRFSTSGNVPGGTVDFTTTTALSLR